MAKGMLIERNGSSAGEAALQLADMAAAAGLPLHEMAAAVLGQEPQPPARSVPDGPAPAELEPRDPVGVAMAERARDGAELVGALAEQLRPRFGTAAVAVWLLEADGALEMLGADGLGGTQAAGGGGCRRSSTARSSGWRSRARSCGCRDEPDAARAACSRLRDRTGALLGVAEAWWRAPREEFAEESGPGCRPRSPGSPKCSACA